MNSKLIFSEFFFFFLIYLVTRGCLIEKSKKNKKFSSLPPSSTVCGVVWSILTSCGFSLFEWPELVDRLIVLNKKIGSRVN